MNRHLPYDLYLLLLIESGQMLHINAQWLKMTVKQKHAILYMIDRAYEMK